MIDEVEAERAALAFVRAEIAGWDAEGFIVSAIDERLPVEGCYVFGWGPPPDDPRRLGGNWPVLVDRESGRCRFVAGVKEYFKLREAAGLTSGRSRGSGP